MGGLGKTKFAQLIYNDPDVENHFDVKAWVCVFEFNVIRLIRSTVESLTSSPCGLTSLDALQVKLKMQLGEKRSLIVLDDVWSEDRQYWNDLLVALKLAKRGSRILVTNRNSKVSTLMELDETYHLKGLSVEDSWLLFKKCISLDQKLDFYPNLESLGREIVKKCQGLPLTINTIGGLLQGIILDEDEWQYILDSEMWDIKEREILPVLRLSCDHLPPHLKQCFAYCSLFPKDHEFEKQDLVSLGLLKDLFNLRKQKEWKTRVDNILMICGIGLSFNIRRRKSHAL
uniref:NB-ARC domain-containing protein n=1 Tax=Nelumbo nucifera TaxID=4432 RepID=A0A822YIQ5_NELNU|nr:TPA_asm: hypothetical protein HUJ06_011223 [Nelumbo nucifera]